MGPSITMFNVGNTIAICKINSRENWELLLGNLPTAILWKLQVLLLLIFLLRPWTDQTVERTKADSKTTLINEVAIIVQHKLGFKSRNFARLVYLVNRLWAFHTDSGHCCRQTQPRVKFSRRPFWYLFFMYAALLLVCIGSELYKSANGLLQGFGSGFILSW